MIPKTTIAVAAALVVGSTWTAHAYQLDPNTGLATEYYYGPISEHAKQGLPVKEETMKKYAPAQRGPAKPTASVKRGSEVRLLEARPSAVPIRSDDKHSGHLW
jgi:hypothetical protein